ncbi:MAG: hypothetical protein MUD00_01705 [Candidatus Pacebacteria bacterium]|jgi:hypothetical protein|nr:hypothetical protein [Candidatus Paceibacterota bacterium]
MPVVTWRIAAGIGIFLSAFWLPFWVTVVLAVFFLYQFDSFYEVFPAFLLVDLLYASKEVRFFDFSLIAFSLAFLLYISMYFLKRTLLAKQ